MIILSSKWSPFKCVKSIFKMQLLQIIETKYIFLSYSNIAKSNSVSEIYAFFLLYLPSPTQKKTGDKTKHKALEGRIH